jgi:hypothetical protein
MPGTLMRPDVDTDIPPPRTNNVYIMFTKR